MDLVCEELGRLGTALLLAQAIDADESERALLHVQLISFMSVHPACQLPVYDGQAIDMSLAMAALFAEGDTANTRTILGECVDRFSAALRNNHYMPVDTDDMEDAMALHTGKEGRHGRFFKTTTWIPLLGTVAAMLGDRETLHKLSNRIVPQLKGVTMERWYPRTGLQTLTGSRTVLNTIGISRAISDFRETPEEEVIASLHLPTHSAAANEFEWNNTPWDVLVAISARMHRHPLPTWYLQQCATNQAIP